MRPANIVGCVPVLEKWIPVPAGTINDAAASNSNVITVPDMYQRKATSYAMKVCISVIIAANGSMGPRLLILDSSNGSVDGLNNIGADVNGIRLIDTPRRNEEFSSIVAAESLERCVEGSSVISASSSDGAKVFLDIDNEVWLLIMRLLHLWFLRRLEALLYNMLNINVTLQQLTPRLQMRRNLELVQTQHVGEIETQEETTQEEEGAFGETQHGGYSKYCIWLKGSCSGRMYPGRRTKAKRRSTSRLGTLESTRMRLA